MEVQGRQLYKLLSNIANAHCTAMDLSRVHGELLLKSFGGWSNVCPFSAEAFDSIKSATCIEEWLTMLGKGSLERLFKAVNISIFEDVENFSKTDFIRLGICGTDAKLLKSWLIQRSVHQEQRQISSLDPSDQSERQGSQ